MLIEELKPIPKGATIIQTPEFTKLFKKLKLTDDDLRDLENITMDIGKELDDLLNKDSKEIKKDSTSSFDDDDDLFNLIDTMYDGDDAYDA